MTDDELDPALRALLLLVNAHGSPPAVRALADLLNGRDAVLKLHQPHALAARPADPSDTRDLCGHCAEYWPCPTAQALNARP